MKIIKSFDYKDDAWTELAGQGFRFQSEDEQRLVFANHVTFEYRMLRNSKGRWEIQQREMGDD